jgi:hypothetical protein
MKTALARRDVSTVNSSVACSNTRSVCTLYTGSTLDGHRRTAGGSSVGWIGHIECGDPDRGGGTPYRRVEGGWSGRLGEAR